MSYSDGGLKMARVAPMPKYDNFMPKAPPIDVPKYGANMEAPVYKAGGEVPRPKSAIGGKKWRATYDQMKTGSHETFHPIYGPQGEGRHHPYKREDDMMDIYRRQKAKEEQQNREERQMAEKTKEKKEKVAKQEKMPDERAKRQEEHKENNDKRNVNNEQNERPQQSTHADKPAKHKREKTPEQEKYAKVEN